ncbi:MAG TPA: hypothetical protein VFH78_01095 [Candidatus Thermoplasmatota archaeon]|nr:hypothetical protein [Candidatus Thermoplasmatota archaeon]
MVRALEELEAALEEFRSAYTEWLEGGGSSTRLSDALAKAEQRLDAARSLLASASSGQSYP